MININIHNKLPVSGEEKCNKILQSVHKRWKNIFWNPRAEVLEGLTRYLSLPLRHKLIQSLIGFHIWGCWEAYRETDGTFCRLIGFGVGTKNSWGSWSPDYIFILYESIAVVRDKKYVISHISPMILLILKILLFYYWIEKMLQLITRTPTNLQYEFFFNSWES